MKNILTIIIALLGLSMSAKAQTNGRLELNLIDQQQHPSVQTLVELLNAKDSSVVQYATTDTKGNVQFNNLKRGKYLAFVPHIGDMRYDIYQFEIRNFDEAFDITLLCKACTEITISADKKVGKIG